MTAGAGLQHSEMFPLLNRNDANPLELFQIWLNLPKEKKFAKPHFAMLWAEDIPVYSEKDKNGKLTEVTVIAGNIGDVTAPAPAPDSWAANVKNEVGIWLIKLEANAQWTIPPASFEVNRSLYFYRGSNINIGGISIMPYHSIQMLADQPVVLENGNENAFLLLLQGHPIDEPVIQHGPFVMNTAAEIQQAFYDYQKTKFGGWPWPRFDNAHSSTKGRFAKYSDGREEVR
jgi:quercetin 2,3-dioxygenase